MAVIVQLISCKISCVLCHARFSKKAAITPRILYRTFLRFTSDFHFLENRTRELGQKKTGGLC
ncbi:MAG: hypothetical protein RR350_06165, partial [Oscillibacter sp.]